jgi:hypothetical protein
MSRPKEVLTSGSKHCNLGAGQWETRDGALREILRGATVVMFQVLCQQISFWIDELHARGTITGISKSERMRTMLCVPRIKKKAKS